MERVALYCRVSGHEQLAEGYSLAEQETRMRLYCEAQGWNIYRTYTDGAQTGSNMDRPALQQLIRDAENHEITKVCVYKLDRLSRSQKDTLYMIEDIFIKNHVDFVSMSETLDTSTPLGMAMIGILSVFAQLERSNIAERMTMGRDARAKSGKYKGGGHLPIGYRYGTEDNLIIDEYEASVIRDIYREFLAGRTASSIATQFNAQAMRGNRSWNAAKIIRTLQQPLYIGLMRWKGEILSVSNAPTIIDEETYNAAQAEIARRSAKNKRPQAPQQHVTLLGGMVWCGICGKRYMAFYDCNNGKPLHRYYCATKMQRHLKMSEYHCPNKGIRAEDLDQLVLAEIHKLSIDPSMIIGSNPETETKKRSAIADRITEINRALDKLIDLYTVDGIDIQSITRRTQSLKAERDNLTDQLNNLNSEQPTDRTELLTALNSITELTSSTDYDKMTLYHPIRKLIRSITITNRQINIEWNV